jgi:SAM-dependent methyltransferase
MLRVRAQIAQRYISGSGIEIGALHNPLQVGPEIQVKYVDRLPIAKLREQYPELQGRKFVDPDIIDDGEILSSIEDNALDFIVANHMLEHCENPLGAIRNHLRKIRPGGILYYAIPEKTQSFDAARETTSFIHLVKDDLWGPEISRVRHFWEWVTFVNQTHDRSEAMAQVDELKKLNHSIHFHVWDEMSFREFVMGAQSYLLNTFEVDYLARNDTEMITVFRKMNWALKTTDGPVGKIDKARNNIHILADLVEVARKAHAVQRDRLQAELRQVLEAREAEINQARKTIDGLVAEIDQARSNILILSNQVEVARKAHLERDRLEGELRRALEGREAEINQARKTIDGLVAEIDQARTNIHILSDQVEVARKAHLDRDRLEAELREVLGAQDERISELTIQLQSLANDLELIRSSWRHRLFHPLDAYRRRKV